MDVSNSSPYILSLPSRYNNIRSLFPWLSSEGIELLNELMLYDPAKRLTARQALRHPYFREKPYRM